MFFALLHRGLLSGEVIPAIFLKREQLSMWKAVLKKRAKSLRNRRGYRLRLCLEFRDLNVAIDLDLYSRLHYFIALLRCAWNWEPQCSRSPTTNVLNIFERPSLLPLIKLTAFGTHAFMLGCFKQTVISMGSVSGRRLRLSKVEVWYRSILHPTAVLLDRSSWFQQLESSI